MDDLGKIALGLGVLTLGAFFVFNPDENERHNTSVISSAPSPEIERTDAAAWMDEIPAPQVRLPLRAASRPDCQLPPLPESSHLVFVSAYEGNAVPNVDLTNGDDVTGLATLDIAPGETPLIILAGSYEPLLWNFIGATERIQRVALSQRKANWSVGAIGIPKSKLTKLGANCLPYEYKDKIKLMEKWRETTGLSPSYVNQAYDINRMHIPSGRNLNQKQTIARREKEADREILRYLGQYIDLKREDHELFRFTPEGVHILNTKDIAHIGQIKTLKLLPDRAGIVQLSAEGTLDYKDGVYHVKRPFTTYPSGLYGAHSVTFVFPDGMPKPQNKAGHSKILTQSEYLRQTRQ